MATETVTFDPTRAEAFAGRLASMLNDAALALMTSLGHRTGLFDTMSRLPAASADDIAAASDLSPRYVREWLAAMVTGGFVAFDPETGLYALPAEHATWLTRDAAPQNLAVATQWFAVLGGVEDDVLAAFRHGQGVPYSRYHRFHEVMAEESGQSVVAALDEFILPLVPGLETRLERGIDVLDVGCGAGRAALQLASRFPDSRFRGYDLSPEAISLAQAEARRRGLNNVHFAVRDAATIGESQSYDLITAFDVIHDQARPASVLREIAAALRPGGTYLMQDISGSGDLHKDRGHPFGPLLYTISCLHCMSVSLANDGPGLGAMWGRDLALRMLAEAGFGDVRVETLPHDPLNFYYIASAPR